MIPNQFFITFNIGRKLCQQKTKKADDLIDVGEDDEGATEINLDDKGEPEKVEAPKEEKIEVEQVEAPCSRR